MFDRNLYVNISGNFKSSPRLA